jgi:hypothetical protein
MASNSPRNSTFSLEIVGFRGFNETAETDSDSLRPRKRLARFQCDNDETLESFKKTSQHNFSSERKFSTHNYVLTSFCGLNEAAEADSAISESNF